MTRERGTKTGAAWRAGWTALLVFVFSAWPGPALGFGWPSSISRVRRELENPGVEVRRRAAQELSRLSPRLSGELVALALGDPDKEVRLSAARAAVVLEFAPPGSQMQSWLADRDPEVRRAGLEVLCLAPQRDQLDLVLRALVDQNVGVRLSALGCLSRIAPADDELVETALAVALDDAEPLARALAAETVGRLALAPLALPLAAKLQDAESSVRVRAAVALGVLDRQEAVPALTLALGDPVPEVVRGSARSLGLLRAATAVPALLALLTREPWDPQSAVAAEALARIGVEKGLQALVDQLGRAAAVEDLVSALGAAGPAAEAPIAACLLSATGGQLIGCLRAASRWAFDLEPFSQRVVTGEVPAESVLPHLSSLSDPDLLILALERLELGGPSEREAILGLLESSLPLPDFAGGPLAESLTSSGWSPAQRARLLGLLAGLQGDSGLDAARPFLQSTQPSLRGAAAEVVVSHSQDVAEIVELLCSDRDTSSFAVRALQRGVEPEVAEGLIRYLAREGGASVSPVSFALEGVGELTPEAQDALLGLLPQAEGEVRDLFLDRLAQQTDLSRVRQLLAQGGYLDRRRLIATVASQNAPPTDLLRAVLSDDDAWVRALAIRGLRETNLLQQLLRNENQAEVVQTAARLRLLELSEDVPSACPFDASLPLSQRAVSLLAKTPPPNACAASRALVLRRARDPVLRFFAARSLSLSNPASPALRSCRTYEVDKTVAWACGVPAPSSAMGDAPGVFLGRSGAPRVGVPFAVWLASSGRVAIGVTDRRGRPMGAGIGPDAVLLDPRLAF